MNFSKLNKSISSFLLILSFSLVGFEGINSTFAKENKINQIIQDNDKSDFDEEFDINKIDINALSKKNKVDPDELRTAIENSLNEEVFSPFSQVEVHNDEIVASSSEDIPSIEDADSRTMATATQTYTRKNQNSTAYLATGNNTASGVAPKIGMCAVHQKKGTPYIPFGTKIKYEEAVTIQGSNYTKFDVRDTGDSKFKQSDYWTDLFFGDNTSANKKAALNYGNQSVTYSYTI